MKREFITSITIIIFLHTFSFGQELVLQLPWGNTDNSIGLRETPEGLYGPQSFHFSNNELQLLDNGSGQIKIFRNGQFQRALPASPAARDFALLNESDYVLTVNNEILYFSSQKIVEAFSPEKRKIITSLKKINSSRVNINFSDGSGAQFQPQSKNLQKSFGNNSTGDLSYRLIRKDAATGLIQALKADGSTEREFSLVFADQNLASLSFTGQDSKNNLFIQVELFLNQVPLEIERRVYVMNTEGRIIAVYKIPLNTFAHIQNDLSADDNGNIFFLFAGPDGIKMGPACRR